MTRRRHNYGGYSGERVNGIFGNQPNNNRLIEPQLLQRFIDNNSSYAFQFPDEFSEKFSSLLQTQEKVTGSLSDTLAESLESRWYQLHTFNSLSTVHLIILTWIPSTLYLVKAILFLHQHYNFTTNSLSKVLQYLLQK